MYGYIFFGFSCLCTCVHAEKCHQTVYAKRETIHVPMGGNLLLSCDVEHCGENNWTSIWTHISAISNKSDTMVSTQRHHLTNQTLSANKTRLLLQIKNLKKSDEGAYGCKIKWKQGGSAQGHLSSVNLTAVVTERSVSHRVLGCVSAILCVLLLLLLARLSSGSQACSDMRYSGNVPKQSGSTASDTQISPGSPKEQQNASSEVVYAEVSHKDLCKPQAVHEPSQPTIYSSLRHGGGAAM